MGILRLWLCFLSLILCAQGLSTRYVSQLEPVEGFQILHSDTDTHLQSLQPNLDLNERGHYQPYPDDLHVKFQAFGRDYAFDVKANKYLFQENAKMVVQESDTIMSEEPLRLTSYHAKTENGAIVVTITPEHLMHALVVTDDEILQVDPLYIHKHDLQEDHYHSLLANSQSKMVVFKHADLDTKDLRCGALETHVAPNNDAPIHLESLPSARNLLALIKFNDTCFSNFATQAKNMTMSFGIDYGFQRKTPVGGQPSCAAATSFVNQAVALMNTVYYAQFNVWLHLKGVVCQASTSTVNWAYDRTGKANCPSISDALNNFSSWRQTQAGTAFYQSGAWMMATDCYPPAGTVGLAWIGGLCRKYYGSGVSSHTGSTWWLVVAHELGHNFGAGHSFQLGQGKTGGIMDYGDSMYQGTIQMHPVYTQDAICAQIRKSSSSSTCGSDCITQAMCWNNFNPTCGNGVIEPPEICDDGANNGAASSCCTTTCTAKAGIECSTPGECCINCMYATGNTSCQAGTGYCSRGTCKSTTCATYSFPYCGTDSANPCKYRCLYSNQCSNMAGWRDSSTQQPFNMNYTDGTICTRTPYGVCTGGVCVTQQASYSWTTSAWSSCSVTCGTGTQTASVFCINQASVQVADTFCTGTKPASTRSCTQPACLVYLWKDDSSAWSTCNKDCGTGWQTRPVPMCYEQSQPTVAVSASLCGTVPATNRTCNTNTCPVAWVITGWNACTVTCGGGTQSPKVTCMQTQNGVQTAVADSLCTSAKPGNQTCNTAACATYSWAYGTYGACSVSCGGGTQTRVAECRDNNGVAAAASNCAGSPVTSQSCNTNTCPNYQWNVGSWSTCTLTCGSGVQNRNVTCVNTASGNTIVADYLCTTTKPAVSQSCNTATCPSYSWVTSAFTNCPVTCGTGTVTRTVTCRDTANNVDAADAMCTGTKPGTSQSCNPGACPTYYWWYGSWGACSKTCGTGTQTRQASCLITGTTTVVGNGNCTGTPVTSQSCNTDPCASYNWVADATWTTCSKVCGGGTQTRTVRCMNTVTNVQASSPNLCTTAAPASQQACNTDLCPGYWYTSNWGVCSLSCGSGTYTRTVECRDSGNQTVVGISRCTGAQPSSVGSCNTFACPAWNASAYGPCSAPCGDGLMTRNVTCWDSVNSVVVAPTQCTGSAPSTQAPCNVMPCPNWVPGNWGPCSVSCGGGTQTRTLSCKFPTDYANPNGIVPPESLCPATKPATSQSCEPDTCPTYYYSVAWGPCSATCGDGTQSGTVSCINSLTGASSPLTNCVGSAPSSTRTCNDRACVVPTWVAVTDWSACNGICMAGMKTRQVACVDTTTNTQVNAALCTGPPLAASASCAADYTCKQGSQCKNFTTGNFCKCPLGYSGPDCNVTPAIKDVTLLVSQFPNGIPLGETVDVQWKTVGYLPFVALLLDKQSWKYPKYITAQAINDVQTTETLRTFAWRVDNGLPVGNDYSLIVYFSLGVSAVYPPAESGTYFQIADPCAYISCSGAGTCDSATAKCNCLPGYDGDSCEISPCAKCNPTYSTCQNDGAARGFCSCQAGWTGETCDVPASCSSFNCQNGGVVNRAAAMVNGTVACNTLGCSCKNFYSGSSCQYCGLTCQHGTPDSSCLTCQCGANSGWMGRDCGCQYYILSVHVKNDQVRGSGTDWVNSPDDLASFKDGFSQDIAASLGIAPKRIIPIIVRPDAVDGPLKDYVEVLFLLTQDCVDFSFMSNNVFDKERAPVVHFDLAAYDNAIAANKFRLLKDQIDGEPTLDELVAQLQAQFIDDDSNLNRGYYSSGVLTSQGIVLVPTDQATTPPKKSKWIDNNYWVIILVVGGVFALALGMVCLRRWYHSSRPIDYNRQSVPATSSADSTTNTRAIYMEEFGKKDQGKPGSDPDLASPELPAGWTKMFEERTGQYYYYNTKSGVSQWELPTTPA